MSAARLARHWEHRLYLAAHPVAYPLLTGIGRLGPVVRVPGLGVVVNAPRAAREVLSDGEHFSKNGPGSSGALWTPVLGPSVLLNMEGPEHRSLRARLAGLFSPASAESLCRRVLPPILDRLDAALRSGTVDLVPVVREAAGAVIGELIGFPGADRPELFARGEEIVSMVGLRTRELTAAQVARAKEVMAEVVAPAADAYRIGDPATAMGRMAVQGLTEAEALGAAAAFFLTGTETVATTVPRLIAMFCDHGIATSLGAEVRAEAAGRDRPDRSDRPDRLDRAIDEGMRVIAPTPLALRRCVRSRLVDGVVVRAGERVLISTLTCTRGAGPFDPDGERPDLRRLWFGAGPHSCIGAPLALEEIRILVRAVLACAPLRIVRRQAARGVLIPAYRVLEVTRA